MVFNGDLKHFEYPLNKITSVEEWKDAVEIASINRQKCQVYVVDEPHKWAVYIKIAISLFSKGKNLSQSKMNITRAIISDRDKHSLKDDIAKTKESLEKMKEALIKMQERKGKKK